MLSKPTTEGIDIIRLNRSLANLRLLYEKVLEDTKNFQFTVDRNKRRYFRMSQARQHVDMFDECRQVLETMLKDYPITFKL